MIFVAGGVFSIYQMNEMRDLEIPQAQEILSIPLENTTVQESTSKPVQIIDVTPKMMQMEDTSNTTENADPATSMMRSMQFTQDSIQSDGNQDFGSENMMDASLYESSLYQDDSMENQNIPNVFSDLCDIYMGEYNYITQICTLQYGTQCQEYDEETIFQCYARDNSLSE